MNVRIDPPVATEPVGERVRVVVGGEELVDTQHAVWLKESGRSPVLYFPLDDVRAGALIPTDETSSCGLKGDANYYSIQLNDGRVLENAVWQYGTPNKEVPDLANRVAFYANHVDDFRMGD